jgi:hypothetical protein
MFPSVLLIKFSLHQSPIYQQGGEFSQGYATPPSSGNLRSIQDQRPTSQPATFELSAAQSGAYAFHNERAFELRYGAQDHHDGGAERAVSVDGLAKTQKLDSQLLELIDDLYQVSDGARQAVERPDHDHVDLAALRILHEPVQRRAAAPGAAYAVVYILFDHREGALLG